MICVKHHVLIGGFLSYMFDALEIVILAIALPSIIIDTGISRTDAGLLVTATLLGIGLSSVTVGWMSDKFGRRRALLSSLTFFGLCTCIMAELHSWEQMLVLRFAAGLGLGGVWSIVSAYISETWPKEKQARATSLVLSSFPLGAGFAAVLSALILPDYGWRALFFTCGVSTIIPIIYVFYFVPESPKWISERDVTATVENTSGPLEIFSGNFLRQTMFATLSASSSLLAYWGVTSWLPTYLATERGFDLKSMSGYLFVLNASTFIGYLIFGFFADRYGKRLLVVLSLLATAMVLPFFAYAEDRATLMALGVTYAFFLVFPGLYGSYFASLYPIHIRTTGAGFCFNIGRGISALAPFALGSLSNQIGFSLALCLCAALYCAGAIFAFFLPSKPSW
ncbi:MFS transporter [Pseudomonas tolaasii]|uniref:MFS transporter n=3 Tax=Pseudomonas tolaasii TaxID=29442 RepID=A0A7Y8AU48_PSETO|nr:MFS transporter [Pseudomonas tolaasii]ARB26666.1 MFS transporter [Pseudomonas tolaasii]KAB0470556.1 MFS transporter [Pseudomonas tolaasii]MBY8944018.1 MFS transporter [Pseudomonas tolaasii]NWC22351.1 MFS transporter [Pseudomonas tolaasii]NWC40334.1 MFS transporter [Pseudomonas tolaasii]